MNYYRRLTNSQKYFFNSYEEDRQSALENRHRFNENKLKTLEVEFPEGGGRTYYITYEIKTIFNNDTFDIRNLPDRK